MFKRARHVLRSVLTFFVTYSVSFKILSLMLILQIFANMEREFLKAYIGIEMSYLYSMTRKWVNNTIGYYLLMGILICILVQVFRYEKEVARKTPQELD